MVSRPQDDAMFSINCTHCHKTSLVNMHNIISMHRSNEGTVAYVKCHCGATAIHVFQRPARVTASWMEDDERTACSPAS